jgi:predicted ester cyclase
MIHYKSLTISLVVVLPFVIQSCNSSSDNEERNKTSIITANDELFDKGNLDHANNVFSEDYAGIGPDPIKDFISKIRQAFPDIQVDIDPIIADQNMVAWVRTNTGTQRGDYMGYKANGKKITWTDVLITEFTPEGKISNEWGKSDLDEVLETASGIEGVYEYLPPLRGQSILRNGNFVYLFGPVEGNNSMNGQAGTYTISGDTIKNELSYSSNPEEIGTIYWWRVISWSGDTVAFETMDDKGQITGGGRAVKISN